MALRADVRRPCTTHWPLTQHIIPHHLFAEVAIAGNNTNLHLPAWLFGSTDVRLVSAEDTLLAIFVPVVQKEELAAWCPLPTDTSWHQTHPNIIFFILLKSEVANSI